MEPLEVVAPPARDGSRGGGAGGLVYLLPAIAGLAPLAYLFTLRGNGANGMLVAVMAVVVGASALGSVAVWMVQFRGRRSRRRWERQRYVSYLERIEAEAARAAATQAQQLRALYPHPETLLAMTETRAGLWQRRRHDPDHLTYAAGAGPVPPCRPVRLALDDHPFTDYDTDLLQRARELADRWQELGPLPRTASLATHPRLAVIADPGEAQAVVRTVLCQLCALQSPAELQVAVLADASRQAQWRWAEALPHIASSPTPGGPRTRLCAVGSDGVADLVDRVVAPRQLVDPGQRAAAASPATRLHMAQLLIVVDGPDVSEELARVAPSLVKVDAVSVVWLLAPGQTAPPWELDLVLSINRYGEATLEQRTGGYQRVALVPQRTSEELAARLAASLAPLALDDAESPPDLSQDVLLEELVQLPAAAAFNAGSGWSEPQGRDLLQVVIGRRADGQALVLDLKESAAGGMGPHGVMVGATGSGKSELLKTIALGLAATHSPELVTFVFVDFKGGSAFADLASLPHCAGMITNLEQELTLVDRMRDALFGEVDRRQRLLRQAGNAADIGQYHKRRAEDPSLEPLAYLIVVIDEFAELLSNRPDFSDLAVSIGRLGRSLGIHLLLATQRLDEGRIRGLESHLRYRLCLRTFSPEESTAILGSRDAFLLPPYPGIGYLRVDQRVDLFRAAKLGDASRSPREASEFPMAPLVSAMAEAGRRAHQVWLPPLEAEIPLAACGLRDVRRADGHDGLRVAIGIVDRPRAQARDPLVLDLAGSGGHLALVGSPRSGRSTFLRTLMSSLMLTRSPEAVHLYCLDLGGGGLHALSGAPHCGAVAGRPDRELVSQVVHHAVALIDEREICFRDAGLDGIEAFRRRRPPSPSGLPGDAVLVVDDVGQLQSLLDGVEADLVRIATAGLAHGVHLVLTANRWADIRPRLRDALGTRLELRLNEPLESEINRSAARALPSVPGRGLTADGLQFQVALAPPPAEVVEESRRSWGGWSVPAVRALPSAVPFESLARAERAPVLGILEGALQPWSFDLAGEPHLLVLGDAESGKTNLLRALAAGINDLRSEAVAIDVIDYRRRLADIDALPAVHHYCRRFAEVQETVAALTSELAAREPAELGQVFAGVRRLLIVDDYDWVGSPMGSPLAPLAEYLIQGQDIGFHVVVARRVGGFARAAFDPFVQRLCELAPPTLIFSGDSSEGPLIGGARARLQPPGRALLVRRGQRVVTIQTVLAPATTSALHPAATRQAARLDPH